MSTLSPISVKGISADIFDVAVNINLLFSFNII